VKIRYGLLSLLTLLSIATTGAQDHAKLKPGDEYRQAQKQTTEASPVESRKPIADSDLSQDEKARVRELERFLGQAYVNSQAELVDQLFSSDWRGFRDNAGDSASKHVSTESANLGSSAYLKSGNDLLHDCQQRSSAGVCVGYILGVLDAVNLEQTAGNKRAASKTVRVCVPSTLDGRQVANVVEKYLLEHPETGALHASQSVLTAAIKTWACPAK
jgi:hypothetical protein